MFRNIAFVYTYYALRYLFPLFVVSVASYLMTSYELALLLTGQSIAMVAAQLVEYGFGLAGSRDIAAVHGIEKDRARVVTAVLSAQCLMAPASVALSALLFFSSPLHRGNDALILPLAMYGLALGFGAGWYFQGSGRVGLSATLEGLGNLLAMLCFGGALAIGGDVIAGITALAMGPILSSLAGWLIITRENSVSLSVRQGGVALRTNFSLFLVRAGITSYTASTTWLMSVLSTAEQTAVYGSALRVAGGVSQGLFGPLVQVMLPHMVQLGRNPIRERETLLRLGGILVTTGIAGAICLYIAAPLLAGLLLGSEDATGPIRILCWMIIPISLSQFSGLYVLVANRKDRYVAISIFIGALFNVLTALYLAPRSGADGMSLSRVLSETVIAVAQTLFAWPTIRRVTSSPKGCCS
jgi:O-antigen/teichoic acid export membrane protein